MGLLGTVSVGGYRAMRRGMEEKGVMQNVNALVRAAYQRAQVDRQPTAIFFWNETVRAANEDDNEVVVGKAVAVRRAGRISRVRGQFLYDEFADLDQTYPSDKDGENSANPDNSIYLYPLDNLSEVENGFHRSTVEGKVYRQTDALVYLSGLADKTENSGDLETFAFKLVDAGGVSWSAGMAYGFEFSNISLPHGYIFGQNYSTSLSSPVREAGVLVFDVGTNTGNGMESASVKSISVYSLRPNATGTLAAQPVGNSVNPSSSY